MADKTGCQCVNCRHGRGELSDDYYKGYLQASFNEMKAFLENMKEYGFEPTSVSEKSVGGLLAVINCDLDETAIILDEMEKKQ